MKTRTRITLLATLLTSVATAVAAPSVDITVTGSIVPGGCTPTLSNALFDHGRLYTRDLLAAAPTVLHDRARTSTLNINCESATAYALRAVDNRADSVLDNNDGSRFGLGLTTNNEKIGSYRLRVEPEGSTLDGEPALLLLGSPSGRAWSPAERRGRSLRNDGRLIGLTSRSVEGGGPMAAKKAALTLTSYLTIAPTDSLTLDDEVPLAGVATLELFYL